MQLELPAGFLYFKHMVLTIQPNMSLLSHIVQNTHQFGTKLPVLFFKLPGSTLEHSDHQIPKSSWVFPHKRSNRCYEIRHSSPSNTKFKNEWPYAFAPPYLLMFARYSSKIRKSETVAQILTAFQTLVE